MTYSTITKSSDYYYYISSLAHTWMWIIGILGAVIAGVCAILIIKLNDVSSDNSKLGDAAYKAERTWMEDYPKHERINYTFNSEGYDLSHIPYTLIISGRSASGDAVGYKWDLLAGYDWVFLEQGSYNITIETKGFQPISGPLVVNKQDVGMQISSGIHLTPK